MTEDMDIDSVYYSNRMFSFDPSPLASMTFVSRPNTQVVVDSDSVAPALRIPLSLVLADMVFVRGLTTRPELAGYDFGKRRIFPLFQAVERRDDLRWRERRRVAG